MPSPIAPRRPQRPRVGELLVQRGYLQAEHVEACLTSQQEWGVAFGRVAISRGYCNERQLVEVLSAQLGVPGLLDGLAEEDVNPRATELLTVADALKYRAVPFKLSGARDDVLHVAFAAPAGLDVQDAVLAATGKARITPVLIGDQALDRAIGWIYQGQPRNPRKRELTVERAMPQAAAAHSAGAVPAAMPFERRSPTPFTAPPSIASEQMQDVAGIIMSAKAAQVVLQAASQNGVTPKEVVRRVVEAWAAPFLK